MGIGFGFGLGPLRFYMPLLRGRRRRSKYWTHPNCTIHHRSPDAADRCKVGRTVVMPVAATIASLTPTAPPQGSWGVIDPTEVKQVVRAAAELVITTQVGSVAMLQRKFQIRFKDAGDIMRILEEIKVVGPSEGSSPRAVLVPVESASIVMAFIDEHVDVERIAGSETVKRAPEPDSG